MSVDFYRTTRRHAPSSFIQATQEGDSLSVGVKFNTALSHQLFHWNAFLLVRTNFCSLLFLVRLETPSELHAARFEFDTQQGQESTHHCTSPHCVRCGFSAPLSTSRQGSLHHLAPATAISGATPALPPPPPVRLLATMRTQLEHEYTFHLSSRLEGLRKTMEYHAEDTNTATRWSANRHTHDTKILLYDWMQRP
jgi:hypothetical protein